MASTDELEDLKLNIANLLHMQIWDDETKSSLDTYMKLRGVQYLVEDHYPNEEFWMAIKVGGKIYRLDMGSSFTTVNEIF
jgi:frataxin-like iron-binding protein CyaY